MSEMVTNSVDIQREEEKTIGPWNVAWHSFRKSKSALIGTAIAAFFIAVAIFGPFIAPEEINEQKLEESTLQLAPPSSDHWFGTDESGRDVFSQVVYGARISLAIGFLSVSLSIVIGSFLGIIAGYYGRFLDAVISRIFDIILAFPSILLAIAIVLILGPSTQNVLIAIAIINIPNFGRLTRAKVAGVKEQEYVVAARAIGMKGSRILWRHVLPNSFSPVVVQGTLTVAAAIMEAAALGFLGLGAEAPEPEWGNMLSDASVHLMTAPWTVIFPGLALVLTVLGFNLMGHGLRDFLEPKVKK